MAPTRSQLFNLCLCSQPVNITHQQCLALVVLPLHRVGSGDDCGPCRQRGYQARLGHRNLLLLHCPQQCLYIASLQYSPYMIAHTGTIVWLHLSEGKRSMLPVTNCCSAYGIICRIEMSKGAIQVLIAACPCCQVHRTWWSPDILSNSSTQHTPRSASTSAPASKLNSPPSRTTLTVRPAEVLVLPQTYTPRGAAPAEACEQGNSLGWGFDCCSRAG